MTRRPGTPVPAGVLTTENTAAFTWPAVAGVTGYDMRFRLNVDTTWATLATQTDSGWTSAVLPPDTKITFQVRATNAGGSSPWASATVMRIFAAPVVTLPAGAVGVADYTATWPAVPGFDAGVHSYMVQTSLNGAGWVAQAGQTAESFTVTGVAAGHSVRVRVRVAGGNTGAGYWSNEATVTRPIANPTGARITAESPGTGHPGDATASVTGACEAGVQVQYAWSDTRVGGGAGWGAGSYNAARSMYEGDSNTFIFAVKCVYVATGAESGSVGVNSSQLTRAWTAPAVPTMYNPSNGNAGTNVTLDWSDTGGYYEVVNSSGARRGYTTSSFLTVARESGSTCGRVRAARSAAAAGAGAWSGWSLTQCGDTVSRPAAPLENFVRSNAFSTSWVSVQCWWPESAGAASYTLQTRGRYGAVWSGWAGTTTHSSGAEWKDCGAIAFGINTLQSHVRANNSAGSSAWKVSGTTSGTWY